MTTGTGTFLDTGTACIITSSSTATASGSPDAEAAWRSCVSLETASTSSEPATVADVPANLFDVSDTRELPTLNIRRPRPRNEPDPAKADAARVTASSDRG
jgi:hypothetical protein